MARMLARHITTRLLDALADRPAVVVSGGRQTGKSTLVTRLLAEQHPARYLTLDDADILAAATADPAGFLGAFAGPVIIDEVQRAPALFTALKASIDRDRQPGRYLLTGSANALLLPSLAEALAGRMEVITLWPLSQGEIDERPDTFIDAMFAEPAALRDVPGEPRDELIERVARGGFPEAVLTMTAGRRADWYRSYVGAVLLREVRSLADIDGLAVLPSLLSLLAARTASLLNVSELSRTSRVPVTTLQRYLALLQATFVVQTVPAWSANLGKRISKAPKLMFADTGLCAQLRGLNRARLLSDPLALGPLLENFVFAELCKQSTWSQTRVRIMHFRSHTRDEVDLVLEDEVGAIVGVEVKSSSSFDARDLKGMRALAALAGARFHRGVVLYTGPNSLPLGRNLELQPVSALWRL